MALHDILHVVPIVCACPAAWGIGNLHQTAAVEEDSCPSAVGSLSPGAVELVEEEAFDATIFLTPPPFSQRTAVPWEPALSSVLDDPGHSASPTAGVPVPHVPPSPQGQAIVTPALYQSSTSESPEFHASPTAGRVLPTIVFSPTYPPPPFIVQPQGGALA